MCKTQSIVCRERKRTKYILWTAFVEGAQLPIDTEHLSNISVNFKLLVPTYYDPLGKKKVVVISLLRQKIQT